MKSVIINSTEYTEIEYIYGNDNESQIGILVHDLKDEFRDGDMIIGNGAELPETEEDAEALLANETGSSNFHEVDGLYFVKGPEQIWYAVLRANDDNDWGTGSYDLDEALAMAREWREDGWEDAFVAVIDESGNEPMCVEEIRDLDE